MLICNNFILQQVRRLKRQWVKELMEIFRALAVNLYKIICWCMLNDYRAAAILPWPAYMTSVALMEMGLYLDHLRHSKSKAGGRSSMDNHQ